MRNGSSVESPFGTPSDQILTGRARRRAMAFLPRHGRGHVHSPTTVPYRANIDALKRLGVTDVISVSACGSFREEMAPGDFVIVDQFIDRTFAREKSFFGRVSWPMSRSRTRPARACRRPA
jgi:5'-methylthioadenosine phosphorylase